MLLLFAAMPVMLAAGQSTRRSTARPPAVVEIHDPGPGMSEPEQQRALQPFVRGEASRNRDSGGTGLGLAIARTVIERHRGTLTSKRGDDGFTVQGALPVE